jgi:hypothetical protein
MEITIATSSTLIAKIPASSQNTSTLFPSNIRFSLHSQGRGYTPQGAKTGRTVESSIS